VTRYLRGTTYDGTCLLHKTTKVTGIHKHSGGYTHTHTYTHTHIHTYICIYTRVLLCVLSCVSTYIVYAPVSFLCTNNDDTHNNTHTHTYTRTHTHTHRICCTRPQRSPTSARKVAGTQMIIMVHILYMLTHIIIRYTHLRD